MPGTIFDLIEEEPKEGKEGFFQLAEKAPQPRDDSFLNTIKDYGKTALKGSIEGFSRLGKMVSGTVPGTEHEVQQQTETLDELLPTDEGIGQGALRRTLQNAPSMLAFPGSTTAQTAIRTGIGSSGAEIAKQYGAPEWAQSAIELTAFIGPDITKKLLESGKDADLIKFAKDMGMTDAEITPLIQSEFKQNWLSKLAPKGGRTEKVLNETQKALQRVYQKVTKSPNAKLEISEVENGKLINRIQEKLNDFPASTRDLIKKDLADLLENPITGESLANFWKDINHVAGKDRHLLSTLKDPLSKAIHSVSPEMGKEFELVNKMYTKFYPVASKLKPTITSQVIKAVEALALPISILTGNLVHIKSFVGQALGQRLSREMLLNPHFQQLGKKMVVAIEQNKFGLGAKIINDLRKEIQKFDPETAEQIQDLSLEDFEKLVSSHKQK
jgi:hypothetical protein